MKHALKRPQYRTGVVSSQGSRLEVWPQYRGGLISGVQIRGVASVQEWSHLRGPD